MSKDQAAESLPVFLAGVELLEEESDDDVLALFSVAAGLVLSVEVEVDRLSLR